jgi:hypothetical protein
LVQVFLKKWWVESDFKTPNRPLSLRLYDYYSSLTWLFHQPVSLNNVWPCTITHRVNYVAFMFKQGYSPSTVKAYLSGISYYIKSNGLEDVTQSCIIQKMMRGMFRLDKRHDCRKPITLEILIKLTEALNKACFSVYESVLFVV